jgi:hypothetical protein
LCGEDRGFSGGAEVQLRRFRDQQPKPRDVLPKRAALLVLLFVEFLNRLVFGVVLFGTGAAGANVSLVLIDAVDGCAFGPLNLLDVLCVDRVTGADLANDIVQSQAARVTLVVKNGRGGITNRGYGEVAARDHLLDGLGTIRMLEERFQRCGFGGCGGRRLTARQRICSRNG